MQITLTELKKIIKEEIDYNKSGKRPKNFIFESKTSSTSKLRKIIQEEVINLNVEQKYTHAKKELSQEIFNLITSHLKKLNTKTTASRLIKSTNPEKIEKIKKLMFSEQIGGSPVYNIEKSKKYFSMYIHNMIGEYLGSLTKAGIENDVFESVSGKNPSFAPGDFPEPGSGVREIRKGSGLSTGEGRSGSGVGDLDLQPKGGSGVINKTGSSV